VQTPVTPEEENVPLTPLQTYDLSQLKLVAILVGTGDGRAMVEDAEGKGYIIHKGVYVGRNFGKVKAVLKDRVIIEERYKDYMGQVKSKEIVLQLHPPGEEK
jgi:type IV pilus assembly protein PilP